MSFPGKGSPYIEDCSEELHASVILCHKEPARVSKAHHRSFPCMKVIFYNEKARSKQGQGGGFGCDELVLQGIRLLGQTDIHLTGISAISSSTDHVISNDLSQLIEHRANTQIFGDDGDLRLF